MSSLSLLTRRFLKIGAKAYSGPAIAGQMKKAIVQEYGWMEERAFLQGLTFSRLLPGLIFIMLSAYIGYRLRRIWGPSSPPFPLFFRPSSWSSSSPLSISGGGTSGALVQNLFKGLGASAGTRRRGVPKESPSFYLMTRTEHGANRTRLWQVPPITRL